MKEPKVIWVKSWRDIPAPNPDSTLMGYSEPKTGDIYAIKKITGEGEVAHEKFHSIKNHPQSPRTFQKYIDNELEAYEYAWETVKKPKHIKSHIRSIFNTSFRYYPKSTAKQIFKYLGEKLYSLDIPDYWKEDYEAIKKEFKKAFGYK